MKQYVGRDVALKETAISIVDDQRRIVREGKAATEPEAIAGLQAAAAKAALWAIPNEPELDDAAVNAAHRWRLLEAEIVAAAVHTAADCAVKLRSTLRLLDAIVPPEEEDLRRNLRAAIEWLEQAGRAP
jgi:hypothetical protein